MSKIQIRKLLPQAILQASDLQMCDCQIPRFTLLVFTIGLNTLLQSKYLLISICDV